MQAMILPKPAPAEESPLTLAEVEVPRLESDDVLIEVAACGVCHTDLHEVEGELALPVLPLIPGHQVVGTVVDRGSEVTEPEVGRRVGVAWLNRSCGECSFCRGGRENLCLEARFTGWHGNGGYAQYMAAPARFVYPLPGALGRAENVAPLLCGGIIGYRALRQADTRPGCRLGLYGFGASAHIALQIAVHWGCRVAVFSRTEDHRRLALDLGARWVGQAQDTPPEPLDSAVIFAPAGWLVPEALRVLDRGGTLALAGIYMTPTPALNYEKHLYFEKTLRSVANATRQDGRDLLDLAAVVPIKTETEIYPLAEANAVLNRLKAGRIQGAAVLRLDAG